MSPRMRHLLLALIAPALLAPADAARGDAVETPAHAVEATLPAEGFEAPVEIRRYAPLIVAEVTVAASDRRAAASAGFRPLANYIFGANAPGQEIAMTAPVVTVPAAPGGEMEGGDGARIAMTAPVTTTPVEEGDGGHVVRFTMPARWTMDSLPAPLDPAVRLRALPERRVAALAWTGDRSAEAVERAGAALDAALAAAGIAPAGPLAVAGYDGPSTPEDRKRWEVWRAVEG